MVVIQLRDGSLGWGAMVHLETRGQIGDISGDKGNGLAGGLDVTEWSD